MRDLYYEGEYQQPDQDFAGEGPDEDAATAAIFAAQTFCEPDGSFSSAMWAAQRVIDAADADLHDATRSERPLPSHTELFSRREMQQVLCFLLHLLNLVGSNSPNASLVDRVRKETTGLEAPPS